MRALFDGIGEERQKEVSSVTGLMAARADGEDHRSYESFVGYLNILRRDPAVGGESFRRVTEYLDAGFKSYKEVKYGGVESSAASKALDKGFVTAVGQMLFSNNYNVDKAQWVARLSRFEDGEALSLMLNHLTSFCSFKNSEGGQDCSQGFYNMKTLLNAGADPTREVSDSSCFQMLLDMENDDLLSDFLGSREYSADDLRAIVGDYHWSQFYKDQLLKIASEMSVVNKGLIRNLVEIGANLESLAEDSLVRLEFEEIRFEAEPPDGQVSPRFSSGLSESFTRTSDSQNR